MLTHGTIALFKVEKYDQKSKKKLIEICLFRLFKSLKSTQIEQKGTKHQV
jgi:hypothetical protein